MGKKYIKNNNEYYIFNNIDINEIEDISELKVNEAYLYENCVYVYYGEYDESKHEDQYGIFKTIDEDGDLVLTVNEYSKKDKITIDDLTEIKQTTNINNNAQSNLLDAIKKMNTKKEKKTSSKSFDNKKTTKKSTKSRGLNKNERNKREDIIKITISEDDELFVRVIKEVINESNVTFAELYEYFGERTGYNMYYGLCTRTAISEQSLSKWCEFLDMEYTLSIRRKE